VSADSSLTRDDKADYVSALDSMPPTVEGYSALQKKHPRLWKWLGADESRGKRFESALEEATPVAPPKEGPGWDWKLTLVRLAGGSGEAQLIETDAKDPAKTAKIGDPVTISVATESYYAMRYGVIGDFGHHRAYELSDTPEAGKTLPENQKRIVDYDAGPSTLGAICLALTPWGKRDFSQPVDSFKERFNLVVGTTSKDFLSSELAGVGFEVTPGVDLVGALHFHDAPRLKPGYTSGTGTVAAGTELDSLLFQKEEHDWVVGVVFDGSIWQKIFSNVFK
jgi:hypothetical protein